MPTIAREYHLASSTSSCSFPVTSEVMFQLPINLEYGRGLHMVFGNDPKK